MSIVTTIFINFKAKEHGSETTKSKLRSSENSEPEEDFSQSYEDDDEAEEDNVLFNNWCNPIDGGNCEETCNGFIKEINKCNRKIILRKSFIGTF